MLYIAVGDGGMYKKHGIYPVAVVTASNHEDILLEIFAPPLDLSRKGV
jgi:hypothetical protein